MVKLDAIRQSSNSVIANAKSARKQYDAVWNNAARAPMFCKITKKTMPDGKVKKLYRTSRLIGAHAYMVAASGAAAHAARTMSTPRFSSRASSSADSALCGHSDSQYAFAGQFPSRRAPQRYWKQDR